MTRPPKYVTFPLTEVAVRRNLLGAILNRIARLAIPRPVVLGRMPAKDLVGVAKKVWSPAENPRVTGATDPRSRLSVVIPAMET